MININESAQTKTPERFENQFSQLYDQTQTPPKQPGCQLGSKWTEGCRPNSNAALLEQSQTQAETASGAVQLIFQKSAYNAPNDNIRLQYNWTRRKPPSQET